MGINWTTTKSDAATIDQIVQRAVDTYGSDHIDRMTLTMDLSAAHANGCPLDLDGLLTAEPFDFAHDVAGINRHIDRDTGRLRDCFLPRCAAVSA